MAQKIGVSRCCIALGGNLGDPTRAFDAALNQLHDAGVTIAQRSTNLRSAPMGQAAGATFTNAAAICETTDLPEEFLARLHTVEAAIGRQRSTHWGPRCIDLDLLFFADCVVQSDALTVPHPALWYRHFVLRPLNEIAPEWIHPVLRETVAAMTARLDEQPLTLEVTEDCRLDAATLRAMLPPHHAIQVNSVAANAPIDRNIFARFLDASGSQILGEQPALEDGRIIRVAHTQSSADYEQTWANFLQDFASAVFGDS